MTHESPDQPQYKLYNDPALLAAVEEGDTELGLSLESLERAEDIARRRPQLGAIALAAEESTRLLIERHELITTEPLNNNSPGPRLS